MLVDSQRGHLRPASGRGIFAFRARSVIEPPRAETSSGGDRICCCKKDVGKDIEKAEEKSS